MKNLVLGVDPAIATLGLSLIERPEVGDPRVLRMAVAETAAKSPIADRLFEIAGDVGGFLADADERHGWVSTVVIEVPSFVRDASASAKLWASYALIQGLCRGRLFIPRSTTGWREALGLPCKIERSELKATTRALMHRRYGKPMYQALADTEAHLYQHAIDALAIATSWHDDMRRDPAQQTLGGL